VDAAQQVLIFGGGGHAKTCIDVLRQMPGYAIAGVVDAKLPIGSEVMGVPVVGRDTEEDLRRMRHTGVALAAIGVGAIGNQPLRGTIYQKLKGAGFALPNMIHPRAAIEPSARMGEGNLILANAVVGSCVRIGSNCIVNAGTVVSHDCSLGNNVHLAPGALLAGGVSVGSNTLIGMGVTVYLGVQIGSNVQVANGVTLYRNVSDGTRVRASGA